MGGSPSKPEAPLDCILKNWKFFKIEGLKKKRVKFYCSGAWPFDQLGNGDKRPPNLQTSLCINNTILQLNLYCCRMGTWSEIASCPPQEKQKGQAGFPPSRSRAGPTFPSSPPSKHIRIYKTSSAVHINRPAQTSSSRTEVPVSSVIL